MVFLISSALFTSLQQALFFSDRLRLELDRKQGFVYSKVLEKMLRNPHVFSASMQLGSIIALVMAGLYIFRLPLGNWDQPYGNWLILILKIIVTTLIILFFSEVLFRIPVKHHPNVFLRILSFPLFFFYIVLFPAGWLLALLTSGLSRNKAGQSDSDYTSLVFAKGEIGIKGDESPGLAPGIGGAGSDEIKLFQNALEFTNVKVRDCMIPRPEITASEINSSIDEIMQKFIETGFSKILIYENTIDNILGYVTSKELFNKPATLKSVLHNISFVIENMTASKLLRKFIQEGKGIAVVVDEFGGVAGLITIEDVMEEIFGEIEDEHDTDVFVEKKTGDKEYIFSGRLEIDHINEKYGFGIPENEEYSTLAGFILYHHGSIPRFNDIIKIGDFSFKIIKAGRNRVELVKLTVEK